MSRAVTVQTFIAELARPWAIYVTSTGTVICAIILCVRIRQDHIDLSTGAIFMGALFGGVSSLYLAKAWEKAKETKHAAEVRVAEAAASTPPVDGGTGSV